MINNIISTTKEPFKQRLKTYLIYSGIISCFFFGLYPLMNHYTSTRQALLALYTPIELSIPFIPEFIWLYLSMYLIFLTPVFVLNSLPLKRLACELIIVTVIGALMFYLFPAKLGFERVLPEEPLYREIFTHLFYLDKPHNLVPSLHVAYSATIVLVMQRSCSAWLKYCLFFWLSGLVLSTLFTHQHHLLDAVSGGMLSLITYFFIGKWYEKNNNGIGTV